VNALMAVDHLKDSPLFRGVDEATRAAFVDAMQRRAWAVGEVIFEKGDPGDWLYVIVSGRVQVYIRDEQGREFTIRHLTPPNTLGEFAILDRKPRSASSRAAEPSELLALHRDDLLAFMNQRPLVGLSMMQNLVERVRYTTHYLQNVVDATQALAAGNAAGAVLRAEPEDPAGAEIQQLVDAFVRMTRSVQAREQALRGARDSTETPDPI
jgi:CRP-like cAMP-binding protein